MLQSRALAFSHAAWKDDSSSCARARQVGGGSGLGLAMVRQLVQAHGGWISVESQLGSGTRFVIDGPEVLEEEVSGKA